MNWQSLLITFTIFSCIICLVLSIQKKLCWRPLVCSKHYNGVIVNVTDPLVFMLRVQNKPLKLISKSIVTERQNRISKQNIVGDLHIMSLYILSSV